MSLMSWRGGGRCALLVALALGLIGLASAEAEAKRIKIRSRSGAGEAWLMGRAGAAPMRSEDAVPAAAASAPGKAEAAQARARAALAAERAAGEAATAWTRDEGPLGGKVGPEAAAVCIAGC
jgi:hypothetical protein